MAKRRVESRRLVQRIRKVLRGPKGFGHLNAEARYSGNPPDRREILIEKAIFHTMVSVVEVIIAIELFVVLFLAGAIFFAIRKGFGEMIRGLESIDERLGNIEGKL